jgi:hypothetical protein
MDREIQGEIQLWLDFAHTDLRTMSTGMRAEVILRLAAIVGSVHGVKEDIRENLFESYNELLLDLQLELRKYFNFILTVQRNPDEIFPLPNLKRSIRLLNGRLMPQGDLMEAIMSEVEKKGFYVPPGFLTLRLFDLMFGRPSNIIKICAACKKLFCYLPKKNKLYCSSTCSWRASKQRYMKKKSKKAT